MSRLKSGRWFKGLKALGVDRAVGYTVLGRGWTALAGIVTMLALTSFLSRVQQGYYFTFQSVINLQVFFELGMVGILVQFASHERSHLTFTALHILTGDDRAKSRLASLLQLSIRWYTVLAILMVVFILPGGLGFFAMHSHGSSADWRIPWILMVFASAAVLAINSVIAVLEGCGLVAEMARVRMVQTVASSIVLWLGLARGMGLYAASAAVATQAVWLYAGAIIPHRRLLSDLYGWKCGEHVIRWREEIWSYQWKIALSWLSGYFISQSFTPILFAVSGPVAAGQMGITLTISQVVLNLALSWITTKSAPFGALVAKRDWSALDALFFPNALRSVAFSALGALALIACAVFANHSSLPLAARLASRIVSPASLSMIMAATVATAVVVCQALYLRAHKQEPFLWLSVTVGVLSTASAFVGAKFYGAEGMAAAYLLVNVFVGLIGGTHIFNTKRREWHADRTLEAGLRPRTQV
ncbi:MAG TPA: hypothetical protein VGK19_02540 [Capsulimonadaceae bacterium]